ncbi:TLDc domain-containing protein [Entamoeba marina]
MFTLNENNQFKRNIKSIGLLKEWCMLDNYTIIFDSDIYGNGMESLEHILKNKNQLYFIHFDDDDNVFGGYLSSRIDMINIDVKDNTSFLFSLIRNGEIKNKKYSIRSSCEEHAFCLMLEDNFLYEFGPGDFFSDITICKIGCKNSCCDPNSYEYNDEKNPLTLSFIYDFTINRILILQMN